MAKLKSLIRKAPKAPRQVAGTGQVAAIGSIDAVLRAKPKRLTLRAWVDEAGFAAIWKSVPKTVRKEMARCYRVVEVAKTIAPKIADAQSRLDKLVAIKDGAVAAQKFLDDKTELLRSFNRTLFDGMHVEQAKRIDLEQSPAE